MNALMERLPAGLRARIPAIPPATPRNLWLLLAAAVATQNLGVFQSSQSEHITVFALLVWGGALICMEDQLEDLDPNPGRIGLVVGSGLLLWIMARTAMVLHWDGMVFVLAPLAGIALGLLCAPPSKLGRFRDSLLCLLLLPAFNVILKLIPEGPLSVLTARLSGFWLGILGFDNVVNGRTVMLPSGGVEVLPACNGVDMVAQVICVAIIFLLAFPVRSTASRILLLTLAPLIGLASNTIRIAILALCVSSGNGKGSGLFTFFHDDLGSLLFSGVAVFVFGMLYMRLLERELPPLPVSNSDQELHQ
ncbi:MAG: archaeosortase/exosortase family protein [Cyanobium sp. ELA507]